MKKGTTRIVFLIGSYAIKIPKPRRWKAFLRGILANLDENLWYKHSPDLWKEKLCPTLFTLGGFILIAKRAKEITQEQFEALTRGQFSPLPCDFKQENFGVYNDKVVLVDYGDSRYFCSDCEIIFKEK